MPSCDAVHNGSGYSISIGILSGAKRPGREADHSPVPNADVKNMWSYTLTPIRLHGVQRSNFYCTSMMSEPLERFLIVDILTC